MNQAFKVVLLAFLLLIHSVAIASAAVTFKNNGTSGTTFKGSDLKNLTATITLPKKLKDYKFDQVRVLLKLSHLDVDGIIYSDRVDLPASWGNSNAITVNVINPDGTSEFEDSSGGVFGLKDFTTVPQRQKLQTMKATVQIKVYAKTGEKWQSWWDRMSRTWKSSSRPVYNAGTVITEGTMTVSLDKLTGLADAKGMISLDFPDTAWSGDTYTWKDLPGERRQFTEIRLARDAGGAIPVDAKLSAFAFDLNEWPELKDKGWAGLKQSVKEDFTLGRNEVQFGWDRLLSSENIDTDLVGKIPSGVWSEATVAGQPGLKAQFAKKETYNAKLFGPLYLTVRPPIVIASWYSYKDGYYDKQMGKDIKLSQNQKQDISAALEKVIAGMKPLKGETPVEPWLPKADPPGSGAGQPENRPAKAELEAPFKVGDQVLALNNMYKFAPAKVVKIQLNYKKEFEYQVLVDGAKYPTWVKSDGIKPFEASSKPEEPQQQNNPGTKVKGILKSIF